MRDFCKPLTNEKQKELVLLMKKFENDRIEAFNKKYLDKGETPPLFETIIDSKNNCVTKIYPNGRMEHNFRHTINWL